MKNPSDDYARYPDHPLHGVPDEVLVAARLRMAEIAEHEHLDWDMVGPLADSMVMAILPPVQKWLDPKRNRPRSSRALMALAFVVLAAGGLLWALGNSWIWFVAAVTVFLALGAVDASVNPIKR